MANDPNTSWKALVERLSEFEKQRLDPFIERGTRYVKVGGILSAALYIITTVFTVIVLPRWQTLLPLVHVLPAALLMWYLVKKADAFGGRAYSIAVFAPVIGATSSIAALALVGPPFNDVSAVLRWLAWCEVVGVWLFASTLSLPVLGGRVIITLLSSTTDACVASTEFVRSSAEVSTSTLELLQQHHRRLEAIDTILKELGKEGASEHGDNKASQVP